MVPPVWAAVCFNWLQGDKILKSIALCWDNNYRLSVTIFSTILFVIGRIKNIILCVYVLYIAVYAHGRIFISVTYIASTQYREKQ